MSNNNKYYCHDTNMRNNRKVLALRAKFGSDGYAVWSMLLEVLTTADNYEIEFDEIGKAICAADFNMDAEHVEEIVEYCTRLHLLQLEDEILSCPALTERFAAVEDKATTISEKRREAGRKGMQSRYNSANNDLTNDNKTDNSPNKDLTKSNKDLTKKDFVITSDNKDLTKSNNLIKNKNKIENKNKDNYLTTFDNSSNLSSDELKPLEVSAGENFENEKQKDDTQPPKTEKPKDQHKEFIENFPDLWNGTMAAHQAAIPLVSRMSDKRVNAIKARIRESSEEAVRRVVENAARSDFLNGHNQRNWIATFDWIFLPNNFPKVLDGNYNQPQTITANGNYTQSSTSVSRYNSAEVAEAEHRQRVANLITSIVSRDNVP